MISELVHNILLAYSLDIKEKRLRVVTTISDSVPKLVLADFTRLSYVLANILNNAIKFSHEEGRILVEVTADEEDDDEISAITATHSMFFGSISNITTNNNTTTTSTINNANANIKRVMFTVRDYGVGMALDQLQSILAIDMRSNREGKRCLYSCYVVVLVILLCCC